VEEPAHAEVEKDCAQRDVGVRRVQRVAHVRVGSVGDEFGRLMCVAAGVLAYKLAGPDAEGNAQNVKEERADVGADFRHAGVILRERRCGAGEECHGEKRENITAEAVEDFASLSHVPSPLR